MDEPLDPATTVPTTALPEDSARASLRGHAGHGPAAWLADWRWRAALESYSCLVEPERDRPDLSGGGSAA